METKTQLTEDSDLNNLTEEEKKNMLHMLAHAPFIKSVPINKETQQNTTEQILPASIALMEYNLNIAAKEEGSKYRIPTEDEFIEALKNAYNGHSPLTPFVDESEVDIREQYQMFAAYFRKVNGNTVEAAIYVAVRITFDFNDMSKFSIFITHSKLKGLEQVRVSWGNLKS